LLLWWLKFYDEYVHAWPRERLAGHMQL